MNTQVNIWIVLSILFIHWISDFVMQTDRQAQGKSKNWGDLLDHTFNYSLIWLFFGCSYHMVLHFGEPRTLPSQALIFAGVTFMCHTITDYFTSRLNSKLWAAKKVHNFFVSIGFDQWLHYLQLLITFQLIYG